MSKGEERLVVHFWMGVMPPCRLLFLSPEDGMEINEWNYRST